MNRGMSLYLDLLRFGAALVVVITHLAYPELSGGMLEPWRLVGNDAVMIFFVLSGYVIAYVRDEKEHRVRDYLLSRLARLWSVAVPALVLTIALDQSGRWINPAAYESWWYAGDAPLIRILAALTFTNELWFLSIRPFSNGPYWSLGYEFWYYVLFAAMTFWAGRQRVLLVTTLCLFVGPKILLLFPIWWMGTAAYRFSKTRVLDEGGACRIFLLTILAYALFRWSGLPALLLNATRAVAGAHIVAHDLHFSDEFISSYFIGALAALHFIAAFSLSAHLAAGLSHLEAVIRWAAQYTFSIYLLHYPLLRFIGAVIPYDRTSPIQVAMVLLATLATCVFVGMHVETHKSWLRRRLQSCLPATSRPTLHQT